MIRLITISGLCYTGTTFLAIKLAELLKWQFLNAGQRFRDYCEQSGNNITSIPFNVHCEFDKRIIREIETLEKVVIEGRYLGYFAKDYGEILKVLIEADFQVRIRRCRQRENNIKPLIDAAKYIKERDAMESMVAERLYNIDEVLNNSFFDLIVPNNDDNNYNEAIKLIIRKL